MKKNWQTSTVAIILIVIIVIGLVMVWFGKITMTDFGILCGVLGSIGTVFIGLFAKDAKNKTFTDCEVKDLKKQVETKTDCEKP